MIGVAAFVIGFIVALIANDPGFPNPLITGAIAGVITFVASWLLFVRDRWQRNAAMRTVRKMLLAREDAADGDFAAHFPEVDSALVAQTRDAVARFFDVPPGKLRPTDQLRRDLKFDRFEPFFHSFVVYYVLNARKVVRSSFKFNTGDLADIGDLAQEIQRVLRGPSAASTKKDDSQSDLLP